MLSTEVFLNFLLSVKQITKAETVSLVISDNNAQQPDVMLLHEGSMPLPEFVTAEDALGYFDSQSNHETPLIFLKSNDGKGLLIWINSGLYRQHLAKSKKQPHKDRRDIKTKNHQVKNEGMVLLGLNFGSLVLPDFIETLITHSNHQQVDFPETSADWFVQMLCQDSVMVWQAFQFFNLFKDPTSCLPGRMAFQVYLKKMIVEAAHSEANVGLIFINPDEFVTINQRLGWSQGDLTLTEIAERLQSFLRENDLVFRYGGAIFALILPTTTIQEVNIVTEKIRNGLAGNYSNITTKLTFSIGAAMHQSNGENDLRDGVDNLIKQADQALNVARLSGGGKSVIWDKDNEDYSVLNLDKVGNIVTSESEKDYRNMLLLWDTIAVISNAYDAQKISVEFVERVKQTLKPFRIGLFEQKNDASIQPLVTLYGQKTEDDGWQLSKTQKKLLDSVQ